MLFFVLKPLFLQKTAGYKQPTFYRKELEVKKWNRFKQAEISLAILEDQNKNESLTGTKTKVSTGVNQPQLLKKIRLKVMSVFGNWY